MDWSVLSLWEWQAMTIITVLSAGLAWWTKRRFFRATAWGCVAVLMLSSALLETSGPWVTFLGIIIGSVFLLLMTRQILDPATD
ncbi:hypothetical protein SAMN04488112_11841 [Melghirimyces thermohalophilus]|uniref:Uncharacterized protein n=1 Tax=Melghirimyces thermohalophilus TaxID=1236220 RepID=A0A1G6PU16_9BACL|nr:hypothetical protein [Melghirimyces thermohalophilus]SDC83623.1 hypothetical protein SAMN04488112_11841 [Melghirimyces thermohalophilus]